METSLNSSRINGRTCGIISQEALLDSDPSLAHAQAITSLRMKCLPRLKDDKQRREFDEVLDDLGLTPDMFADMEGHLEHMRGVTLGQAMTALQGNIPDKAFARASVSIRRDFSLLKADKWPFKNDSGHARDIALEARLNSFSWALAKHWNERVANKDVVTAWTSKSFKENARKTAESRGGRH